MGADLVDAREVGDVDLADERAAAGDDGDEAVAVQALDRLAHRRAADPEPAREVLLAQQRAGSEGDADDLLAQLEVGAVGERARPALPQVRRRFQRGHGAHLGDRGGRHALDRVIDEEYTTSIAVIYLHRTE